MIRATARPIASGADSGLRVARAMYFVLFAATGAFFPFINLYYRSIGLSGAQIGVIGSVSPLVGMIAGPLWGMISDRFGVTRPLLITGLVGAALCALGLLSAPTFLWLAPVAAAYAFFTSPIMPLLDSTTLDLLEGRRELYGRQRLWGSIGFVFTALGFGRVIQQFGLPWLFYGYMALIAVAMVIAFRLPARRTRLGGTLRRGLAQLVRQRAWLIFSASLLVLGIANSGMHTFLNIYVKEMGGGEGLVGLMWAVAAITEVPVMFLAGPLVARLGARRTIAIAYLAYTVRWLLYGMMPAPTWAVPISLLQGVTFAPLWVAGVAYADALAPRELKATAQGMFAATLFSLSGVIGGPISGLLFDALGAAALFRLYCGFGLAALGLLWWGSKNQNQ